MTMAELILKLARLKANKTAEQDMELSMWTFRDTERSSRSRSVGGVSGTHTGKDIGNTRSTFTSKANRAASISDDDLRLDDEPVSQQIEVVTTTEVTSEPRRDSAALGTHLKKIHHVHVPGRIGFQDHNGPLDQDDAISEHDEASNSSSQGRRMGHSAEVTTYNSSTELKSNAAPFSTVPMPRGGGRIGE